MHFNEWEVLPHFSQHRILNEVTCFKRLLDLKFPPKDRVKMVGSIYRSRKYLTPSPVLYLYKIRVRPKMEYCWHLWTEAAQSSFSGFDWVQNRFRGLVEKGLIIIEWPLSNSHNVISYRYFHSKCSDKLFQIFTV